jgi:hypothetical protein
MIWHEWHDLTWMTWMTWFDMKDMIWHEWHDLTWMAWFEWPHSRELAMKAEGTVGSPTCLTWGLPRVDFQPLRLFWHIVIRLNRSYNTSNVSAWPGGCSWCTYNFMELFRMKYMSLTTTMSNMSMIRHMNQLKKVMWRIKLGGKNMQEVVISNYKLGIYIAVYDW